MHRISLKKYSVATVLVGCPLFRQESVSKAEKNSSTFIGFLLHKELKSKDNVGIIIFISFVSVFPKEDLRCKKTWVSGTLGREARNFVLGRL